MVRVYTRYLLVVLLLAAPGSVFAGTLLTYAVGQGESAGTSRMYLRADAVRITNEDSHYMLYKADKDTLYIVQPKNKTYTVLDKAQIKKLGQRMKKARARMRERIKKLPKDQQAQMEKRMGSYLEGKGEPVTVSKTGETAEVAGYQCEKIKTSRNGKGLETLCLVSPSTLDISHGEYAALENMFKLFRRMSRSIPWSTQMPDLSAMKGVPVSMQPESDKSEDSRVLQKVSHEDFKDSLFELPGGYKRADLAAGE